MIATKEILNRKSLHSYQIEAVKFVYNKRKCALFLDMGLGKTVSSLTVVSDFLDSFISNKIIVIAPLMVANGVWKQEAAKWDYLKNLKIAICTGSIKERTKAVECSYDILVINRENITWLIGNYKWIWDTVIVDESTSFKSSKSKRFKDLKKMTKHIANIILLTGTPSPNGLLDLWSQMYLIDNGKRLGRTMTQYKQRFFTQDYSGFKWTPKEGAENEIKKLISDVCLSMKAVDYLKMPGKIILNEEVMLTDKLKKQYKELEKKFVLNLKDKNIIALSGSALSNKLLQFCNGAIYDEDGGTNEIHDLKLKRLKEIIQENPNERFLIAYNFKSDLKRILKSFPEAVILSKNSDIIDEWNNGKIKMLLAHPASACFGLNLQQGGSILLWFGLNWSLELYEQFNARLYRQGQSKTVRIIHIVAKDCLDFKILSALKSKAKTQNDLINYLNKSFNKS